MVQFVEFSNYFLKLVKFQFNYKLYAVDKMLIHILCKYFYGRLGIYAFELRNVMDIVFIYLFKFTLMSLVLDNHVGNFLFWLA